MNNLSKMLARKFVLAKPFEGLPKLSDFQLVEETISPELQEGEILAKAEWLTVDPYMRLRSASSMSIGDQFGGGQVARVIKSRCDEFPEGSQVVGYFGWRDLTVYKPVAGGPRTYQTIQKLPEMKGLPDSYALGCMGMPGNTAYHGLLDICNPKAGETLVVSAAAGAVGSLVGQIGKIKGLKVIGFAGDEEKVRWLTEELGFDLAFNYKKVNLDETFKKYAPQKIDCYFDNVGDEFIYHVVQNMNEFGRISQCGSISMYNKDRKKGELPLGRQPYPGSLLALLFFCAEKKTTHSEGAKIWDELIHRNRSPYIRIRRIDSDSESDSPAEEPRSSGSRTVPYKIPKLSSKVPVALPKSCNHEQEIRQLSDELNALKGKHLQGKLRYDEVRTKLKKIEDEVRQKDEIIQSRDKTIRDMDAALEAKELSLQTKDALLQSKDQLLQSKDSELSLFRAQLSDIRNREIASPHVVNHYFGSSPQLRTPSHHPPPPPVHHRLRQGSPPPHIKFPIGYDPTDGMYYLYCSARPVERYWHNTTPILEALTSLFGDESKITLYKNCCKVFFDSYSIAASKWSTLEVSGKVSLTVQGIYINVTKRMNNYHKTN